MKDRSLLLEDRRGYAGFVDVEFTAVRGCSLACEVTGGAVVPREVLHRVVGPRLVTVGVRDHRAG